MKSYNGFRKARCNQQKQDFLNSSKDFEIVVQLMRSDVFEFTLTFFDISRADFGATFKSR